MKKIIVALSMVLFPLFGTGAVTAPTPVPGERIDLQQFTVNGVGLSSTAGDVKRLIGPPEEEQKISASEDAKEAFAREETRKVPLRRGDNTRDMIIYAYMKRGIRIIFMDQEPEPRFIELFVNPSPPYASMTGSLTPGMPLNIREGQLLRPLIKQIYKEGRGMLFLKKDEGRPHREIALLEFTAEGWLTKITFRREENLDIDLDRFCVGGLCLGDPGSRALELLGSPDACGGGMLVSWADWWKEGIRVEMRKSDEKVNRIRILPQSFDGGFSQPLALMQRKSVFHDYLTQRIYQEGLTRICAYRKGDASRADKALLGFDEDDRLISILFETSKSVVIDYKAMSIGGVRVGDSPQTVLKLLGNTRKWRDLRNRVSVGYTAYGIRVLFKKKPAASGTRSASLKGLPWGDLDAAIAVEVLLRDAPWVCSTPLTLAETPLTLAETEDDYSRKAGPYIFRRKGDTIYMSGNGRSPVDGVATLIAFDRSGWPQSVTFKAFQDIPVDMKAFTVAGIGLGTHADQIHQVLGRPEKAREIKEAKLLFEEYVQKGLAFAIDPLNRTVCKIIIAMDRFEGDFAQGLS
ncbi:MAG: hypothetical protein NT045_03545, partial [Candidatus Aureabacteria bacterium]|nr:hypothetical protein [Candidatus Auribacterota bacterium]